MKVLILNASPRRKGVTTTLLDEIEGHIASHHSIDSVRIYGLRMKPCVGCLRCRPDKVCALPRDDAHALAEKVKACDLLIVGSPVYWGNVPGPLKVFFDRNVPLFERAEAQRMTRVPEPQLKGKKAILVVTSASPYPYNLLPSQSRGAVRALKTVLRAGGVQITRVLNVPDSYSFPRKGHRHLRAARRIAMAI